MDQLIRYKQYEAKGIKKGILRGGIGISLGSIGALVAIFLSEEPIAPNMIGGIIIMFLGISLLAYKMLQKEPAQAVDQITINYLKLAKERLIARKNKLKKYLIIYVMFIIIGMGMIMSMLSYFIFVAIVIGGITHYTWDVEKELLMVIHLEELDRKIADLK